MERPFCVEQRSDQSTNQSSGETGLASILGSFLLLLPPKDAAAYGGNTDHDRGRKQISLAVDALKGRAFSAP